MTDAEGALDSWDSRPPIQVVSSIIAYVRPKSRPPPLQLSLDESTLDLDLKNWYSHFGFANFRGTVLRSTHDITIYSATKKESTLTFSFDLEMVEIRSFNIKLNTTLIGSRIVSRIRCNVVKSLFLTIKLSVFQSIRSRFYCGSLYVVLNIFIVSSYTVLSVLYYIIFCRRSSNLPYIIFYFYHLAIPILFKTVYNYSFHETIINFLLTIVDGNRRPGGQESQVVSRVINQHETLSIHRLVSQQESLVVSRLETSTEGLSISRLVTIQILLVTCLLYTSPSPRDS